MAEEELLLPKASIHKLIKENVQSEMRVAGDAIDMFVACCTEFVHLLSSQANEISEKEKKQTVNPEHILKAIEELGYSDYGEELRAYLEEWKQESKATGRSQGKQKNPAQQSGLSEEQQIALQKQMFAAAKARSMNMDPAAGAP